MDEVSSDLHAKHVREDFRSGVRSGVNGTPTFFINGFRYDGSHDDGSMVALLGPTSIKFFKQPYRHAINVYSYP